MWFCARQPVTSSKFLFTKNYPFHTLNSRNFSELKNPFDLLSLRHKPDKKEGLRLHPNWLKLTWRETIYWPGTFGWPLRRRRNYILLNSSRSGYHATIGLYFTSERMFGCSAVFTMTVWRLSIVECLSPLLTVLLCEENSLQITPARSGDVDPHWL